MAKGQHGLESSEVAQSPIWRAFWGIGLGLVEDFQQIASGAKGMGGLTVLTSSTEGEVIPRMPNIAKRSPTVLTLL